MKDLFPPSSFTKTIGNHSLVERLDPLPMAGLLTIRAKIPHFAPILAQHSLKLPKLAAGCF
jgi:hypothetical protein